ncbi:MAG: hypothetical protein KF775_07365 [Cyclobacteriaceae bacterium]|nr:hypothetical protein [Cyclobacteriaceae bacterium]
MTKRTTIIILIGLLLSTNTFGQDEIFINILPSKISTDISILIPNGQSYTFEKYHYFKYVYWVTFSDTLYKSDNGLLQGKRVSINQEHFSKKVAICDTTINKIRNLALDHKLSSDLLDVARKEIGGNNQEFKINEGRPTERQAIDLCHTDFKTLIESWFNKKSIEIRTIKEQKIRRLEKIRLNQTVNKVFIKTFLEDCDFCETDQIAILELIKIIFLLLLFALSCTEEKVNPNLTFHEQIALDLNNEGYFAAVTEKGVLIGGFESRLKALEKLNQIFDSRGYSDAKFDIRNYAAARTLDISCSAGPIYESGDAYCQNFLCIGDSSYSILWYADCYNGTCYMLSTTCIQA